MLIFASVGCIHHKAPLVCAWLQYFEVIMNLSTEVGTHIHMYIYTCIYMQYILTYTYIADLQNIGVESTDTTQS